MSGDNERKTVGSQRSATGGERIADGDCRPSKFAYFAGGCFWCVTPFFREAPGVRSVTAGFSGGDESDPSYEDVKRQLTGHRECVRVEYAGDYAALCDVFLASVDPFDPGGQYIDRGRSYTLAIYYTCAAERAVAEAKIAALAAESGRTPRIALEPFRSFYEAPEEHQDYDLKNPDAFERELRKSGRK